MKENGRENGEERRRGDREDGEEGGGRTSTTPVKLGKCAAEGQHRPGGGVGGEGQLPQPSIEIVQPSSKILLTSLSPFGLVILDFLYSFSTFFLFFFFMQTIILLVFQSVLFSLMDPCSRYEKLT